MTSLSFPIHRRPDPTPLDRIAAVHASPGSALHFTDHMAVADWTTEGGWSGDEGPRAYGPFSLDPASAVLHYAQEIFEGLKAFRRGTAPSGASDRRPTGSGWGAVLSGSPRRRCRSTPSWPRSGPSSRSTRPGCPRPTARRRASTCGRS